ncbi:hypothetical protein KOW79_008947 [Hemibagrus wyckioides]|uniref:Uncharacterized protein n=1 Tax=Hemibagrus wyckioides TaxID=337641 RepID=A0A9D3NPS6_9TELE|nr:hypothetical protein KOW79_008947 [Hemibagrus wyckioides]
MKPSTLVIPGGEGTLFPPAFTTTYTLTSEKQASLVKTGRHKNPFLTPSFPSDGVLRVSRAGEGRERLIEK